MSPLDCLTLKTYVVTPRMWLYVLKELCYVRKCDFDDFVGGHFENDVIWVVQPNLEMVASPFHV